MKSWMQRAREASNQSPEACAQALRISVGDYLTRENNPGMLTVNELVALSFVLDRAACRIIADGVRDAII